MTWYKTGTVSVVQNSDTVIGAGTAFIKNGRVGDAFRGPDGKWYEVINIASDTALAIAPNYQGATSTDGAYALAPMQGYVKDTADALRQASLEVGDALDGLEESVQQAADSADAASASKDSAATSASGASGSAAAALASKNAAATSETNASSSAGAALSSKNAAATSETNASGSAAAALSSKNAAALSESNAAASAATAASIGVGKGYIDGLRLVYTGRNSLTIEAGAAFINSAGKVVRLASDKVLTGLTLTASTFHHAYLYDNAGVGDIELSTVVPAKVGGSVYQKTGDASRRYVGSVLASAGSQIYKFKHDPQISTMTYIEGTPGTAPFTLFASFAGTSPTVTNCDLVFPKQVSTWAIATSSGANINFTVAEQASASGGANWGVQASGTNSVQFPLSREAATLGQYIVWVTATSSLYGRGYIFER
ncbi:hypothetical protein [Pseudomonas aphyarum]|uniref:Tail fiber protein n=1 Tax=Pseudomonas aphyarum TaxID=2942629 RepID=A0ABT5PNI2_9PSED|nr:hypothetical protein [Pseudomonas aphyarum]MDD0971598.1 hypothetical protein [Pseudomonas aphyarum]MDD1125250.1 hypothetical protein [Pseudomonas aphyarum]